MGTKGYLLSSLTSVATVARRTLELLPSAEEAYDLIFGRSAVSKENEDMPAAKRQRRSAAADLSDVKNTDQDVNRKSEAAVWSTSGKGPAGASLNPASNFQRKAEVDQHHATKVSVSRPYLGCHSVQNTRPYQEDRSSFIIVNSVAHLAIYDGHAGSNTSSYLQAHLLRAISSRLHDSGIPTLDAEVREAIEGAYHATNETLRGLNYGCGSTSTTVLLDGNRLVCANCGDSPAFVVMQSGDVYLLTADHSPNCDEERRRVEGAGGRVAKICWGDKGMRVISKCSFAGLAMTRAFGDYKFTGVVCDPFICTMDNMDEARYIVLASDGLTEAWSVEDAARHLMQLSDAGHSTGEIARRMTEKAISLGSRDNVTVMVMDVAEYMASPSRPRPGPPVWEAAVSDGASDDLAPAGDEGCGAAAHSHPEDHSDSTHKGAGAGKTASSSGAGAAAAMCTETSEPEAQCMSRVPCEIEVTV